MSWVMFCCLLLLNKLFSFVHPCRSAGCCYRKFRVSLTVSVWVTLLPLPPAGSEVWSQVQVVCVWVPVWVGVVSSSELTWHLPLDLLVLEPRKVTPVVDARRLIPYWWFCFCSSAGSRTMTRLTSLWRTVAGIFVESFSLLSSFVFGTG